MQCKICNEIFKSNKDLSIHIRYTHKLVIKDYYDEYLKQPNEGKCLICGNTTNFTNISKGYTVCCKKCRYKNKHSLEKREQTYLKKYGVKHIWHTNVSIQKAKESKKLKYDSEVVSKNKDIINKIKQTKIDNIIQFEQENDCINLTKLINQIGEYNWYFSPSHKDFKNSLEYLHRGQNTFVKNEDIPKIIDYINNYIPCTGTSKIEQYIYNEIKNYCKYTVKNRIKSVIKGKELDIYIPNLKLAIEFNGEYWHSIEAGCDKDHLLKKSLLCKDKGIRLIHIYEWENIDEQIQLLKDLIDGKDNYPKEDFNKNNFLDVPKPYKYKHRFTIYTVGKLY